MKSDPHRAGLSSHSAGKYLTLQALLRLLIGAARCG
jgi:hypothetical protein